jgi:hypothetical protein
MAQSDDTINDPIEITTDRDELPEGQARLVIREEGITHVIQGDAEKVEQWFYDHLDEELGTDGEKIEEYPHPEFGEGLVPAEEFYADSD